MNAYEKMTAAERESAFKQLRAEYQDYCDRKLSLNMARGKPGSKQLDLVTDMLTVLNDPSQ